MNRVVVLDAGPLSLVAHPRPQQHPEATACARWFYDLLAHDVIVAIPEIADYEVRRELLRANKQPGLQRLDALKTTNLYLPITTAAMLQAAALWALARNTGQAAANNVVLDADMILIAQARLLTQVEGLPVDEQIIATTNVKHLARFTAARLWQQIAPV